MVGGVTGINRKFVIEGEWLSLVKGDVVLVGGGRWVSVDGGKCVDCW